MEDVFSFVDFLRRYFVISQEAISLTGSSPSVLLSNAPSELHPAVYLKTLMRCKLISGLYVYATYPLIITDPIKSCAGESLTFCKLNPTGLSYDREFMLVNSGTGRAMSQKQFPRMSLIRPIIRDEEGVMRVRASGMEELIIRLDEMPGGTHEDVLGVKVCSDVVHSYQPSSNADDWFSTFLGLPCQLHRHAPLQPSPSKPSSPRHTHFEHATPVPILLSNESPFTLISNSSVNAVNSWIACDNEEGDEVGPVLVHPSCFRANFAIASTSPDISSPLPPFHEDRLDLLRIGTETFQVLARCRRCLMICVNQKTGVRMKEPFCCLARHRRNGRKRIEFGVHLMWRKDLSAHEANDVGNMTVRLGDRIAWTELA